MPTTIPKINVQKERQRSVRELPFPGQPPERVEAFERARAQQPTPTPATTTVTTPPLRGGDRQPGLEGILEGQFAATVGPGRREIRTTGEELLRGTRAELAAGGHADSLLGQAILRDVRSATTMREEQLVAGAIRQRFEQQFQFMMAESDRRFRAAEAERDFTRNKILQRRAHEFQLEVLEFERATQLMLADLESGTRAWEAFGSFVGSALPFVGPAISAIRGG
jgi:hypothetical protein